ncbi:hypothetical protein [Subtercola endophyticus]|uniref:hypothetical protein n=1 Tax=Subtercola endophyticus TaxID=2895559 RepID=UPI001E4E6641|nr:hypothetical protein [Subtercola endophyticus]UFS60703.1 hypothetical protein LQ955_08200 [Subtercola endophyticus]
MTLNSQNMPEPIGPRGPNGKKPKIDRDIRNHPDYKTPWWRKPMTNSLYWIVFAAAAIVVVAAIVITLSLGVKLF